jgi:hypothetical protein
MKAIEFINLVGTKEAVWFLPTPTHNEWLPAYVFGVNIINNTLLL